MKVLVFGTRGQLARSLADIAQTRPDDEFVFVGSDACDIADLERVRQVVAEAAPDGIVNAAAYTAVDKAESDELRAYEVNCIGAGNVARAADAAGAALVHVSTDYVFDGRAQRPYREDDSCFPLSAYGRSKLAGEFAVRTECPRSTTLRTSWVFSPYGANFVKTMIRLAQERPRLSVVDDQVGKPTCAADLARAAITALAACRNDPEDQSVGRLYHFAGPEEMSWCGFARLVLDAAGRRGYRAVDVAPITTRDYPTPARRPANSRLDTNLGATVLGLRHRPIAEVLEEVVDRLLG